jgi:PAS domain-containing protein
VTKLFSPRIATYDDNRRALLGTRGHAVQFYENQSTLIDTVSQHFAAALAAGDTAIAVATAPHLEAIANELSARGMDLNSLRASHHYIEMEAAEALGKFMVQGWPDAEKFNATVGRRIARAEALSQGHHIVVFGEMVALLWAQGRHDATFRLERLWNDFAERHSFFLLCGYPLDLFSRSDHLQMFFNICGEHSHVNPAESYPQHDNEKQRGGSVARVEQKARALENEIRLSQERILLLQSATRAGTWELDLADDTLSLSSVAAKLLKMPFGRIPVSSLLAQMYYSGDRDAVRTGLKQAQRGRENFAVAFRIRDGEATRVLQIRGKAFYNSGSPIMLGVLLDLTPAEKAA